MPFDIPFDELQEKLQELGFKIEFKYSHEEKNYYEVKHPQYTGGEHCYCSLVVDENRVDQLLVKNLIKMFSGKIEHE